MNNDTCNCGAYGFPHRYGGGLCSTQTRMEHATQDGCDSECPYYVKVKEPHGETTIQCSLEREIEAGVDECYMSWLIDIDNGRV